MTLREKINGFMSFVLSADESETSVSRLIQWLDELALLVHECEATSDIADFPEAPPRDFQVIRLQVEARFSLLGFYNTVDPSASVGEANEMMVGDAIDDITDIMGDLQEVEWRFANTSVADARWYFVFSFRHHWGQHLRDVQGYLHRFGFEK